jgi:hypothetical protein
VGAFLLFLLIACTAGQEAAARAPRRYFNTRARENGVGGRFSGRFAKRVQPSIADVLAGNVPVPAAAPLAPARVSPAAPAPAPAVVRQHGQRDCDECQARCARVSGNVGEHDDCSHACIVEWYCNWQEAGCPIYDHLDSCRQQDRSW